MADRIENGEKYFNDYGREFTLELVSTYTINEWTISVYHERSDEELETVQDHFTVEVYEIDRVTFRHHGLDGKAMAKAILENMPEM